jgi:hypothetical protein
MKKLKEPTERQKLVVQAAIGIYLQDMEMRLNSLKGKSEGVGIEEVMIEAVVDAESLVDMCLDEENGE